MKANIDVANENAELKRLLRLAMEGMSEAEFCCTECIHRHTGYDKCGDDNCFEWKHADEAEKLLGDKE